MRCSSPRLPHVSKWYHPLKNSGDIFDFLAANKFTTNLLKTTEMYSLTSGGQKSKTRCWQFSFLLVVLKDSHLFYLLGCEQSLSLTCPMHDLSLSLSSHDLLPGSLYLSLFYFLLNLDTVIWNDLISDPYLSYSCKDPYSQN